LRKDTISLKNKDSIINLTYDKDASVKIDSLFANLNIHGEAVRLLVKQTDNAVISIGYILSDINSTTNQLFAIQIIAFPFILIISVIGGLLLSKVSLKTIENITQEADAISASNLSNRLPVINTNDEVGHLTRTLNQMIERLESSFNQIKKFTSDASHELRTPLTILQGELEIALHSQKTPAQYEDIIISALEEVARLTNVVETLLDLSRAESGQVKMNLTEGSLTKLLIDMSEDAEILAESRGVNVTSEIEPDVNLPFDSARMHQAILNIVDNAIKYTKKGGNVLIQLIKTKDNAEIIISDTGNGIPADDLPYIFDRLYRVDKARSSNIFGVGLGLAIVKWIIEGHNGKISVESEVNKGTKFTIRLKLKH
jgi:heavy metal sensor kinase